MARAEKAVECMEAAGVKPNAVTWTPLQRGNVTQGDVARGKEVVERMQAAGIILTRATRPKNRAAAGIDCADAIDPSVRFCYCRWLLRYQQVVPGRHVRNKNNSAM